MGLTVEIAAVRSVDLHDALPDVFGLVEETMGYEDATSSARAPHLCVGRIRDWTVVVDVLCRLTGYEDYLTTASAGTDLHVVRVADGPIALHYRHGLPVSLARGRSECRAVAPREMPFGDGYAWEILEHRTGLTYNPDLWDAQYTLARLD